MEKLIIIYLILINIITYFIFALDKHKARHGLWRIPENILIGLAAAGGSIGAFLAMKILHHKTFHDKFVIGIPLIFLLQIILAIYFYTK